MSTFVYQLPTTGAVSFHDFIEDPSGRYTTHLADATVARANVRSALKEIKRSDGERDHLKVIKVSYPLS
jgi:hypothetical protein